MGASSFSLVDRNDELARNAQNANLPPVGCRSSSNKATVAYVRNVFLGQREAKAATKAPRVAAGEEPPFL